MADAVTFRPFQSHRDSVVSKRRKIVLVATWMTAASLATGCGSETARRAVHGTVRVDGETAPHGSISFFPDQGHRGPAASTSITNGHYRFDAEAGPAAGPHLVVVGIEIDTRGIVAPPATLGGQSDAAKRAVTQTSDKLANTTSDKLVMPAQWQTTIDVPGADSAADGQPIDFAFPAKSTPENAKRTP